MDNKQDITGTVIDYAKSTLRNRYTVKAIFTASYKGIFAGKESFDIRLHYYCDDIRVTVCDETQWVSGEFTLDHAKNQAAKFLWLKSIEIADMFEVIYQK